MPNMNPDRDNPNYPNPNYPGQGWGSQDPNVPGYDPNAPDQSWGAPNPNVPDYDPYAPGQRRGAPDQSWGAPNPNVPGYEPDAPVQRRGYEQNPPAQRRGNQGQNMPRQDSTGYAEDADQYAAPSDSNFTAAEWKVLLTTPLKVGKAMMFAAPSGPLGMIQEAKAMSDSVRMLMDQGSPSPLLAQLGQHARGILQNAQSSGGMSQVASEYIGSSRDPEITRTEALTICQQAVSALRKTSPQDAAAYKQFVFDMAQKTAEAAAEGGILGMGGQRVSEPEQMLLREVAYTLGMQRA